MVLAPDTFRRYTVRVIVLTNSGIPLVADLGRPKEDRFWKFPGGGNKAKDLDNIKETARRELKGETDIDLDVSASELLVSTAHQTSGHPIHLVFGRPLVWPVSVLMRNEDNEAVRLFSPHEIVTLVAHRAFLPQHIALLRKAPPAFQRLVLPETLPVHG